MKPGKIIATLAIVGGVAAGAAGVSAGVANADPGPSVGPAPVRGPLHRHHGTATDMDGMEMDGAVADGTVPDGAAVPHQAAGTAVGSRGEGMPIRPVRIGRVAPRRNTSRTKMRQAVAWNPGHRANC